MRRSQGTATFSTLDPDGAPPALETTNGNWIVVRAYDAKPAVANFPWTLFTTEVNGASQSNLTGRLAAVATKSNGSWQASLFSYDADGRVATRYTYTHANGGTTVLTAINTTATYTRDLRDALIQRNVTVGTATFNQWYDYDGRGLLWKVSASTTGTKPGSPDVTYTYRPSGQVQNRQFAGGPLVPVSYTIREQVAKIGDPALTTYPFSAGYTYNNNGTVAEADFYNAGTPATAKRYKYAFGTSGYDALNRMKSADFSSWSGTAWTSTLAHDLAGITYDAAGNLTALQRYKETGVLIDNLTYTNSMTSNRLNSVTDAVAATPETWDAETGSFTYDVNGNLATAPAPYSITAVTYDHLNLPVSLTRSGTTSSYRYDHQGQRTVKQVGTNNAEYYILEGRVALGVFTMTSGGTVASSFFNVIAGGKAVGRQPNVGNRRYYHVDLLGSIRSVVDGATVVETSDPDPWGLAMPGRALSSGTKEAFTGKEQDAETGLVYFGARYYLPAVGRWTGVDPLGARSSEWSPYNYAFNNVPLTVDPRGLSAYVVDCAPADKDCKKHSTDFENARQQALRDRNPEVRRAAEAYGAMGEANGVVVTFGVPEAGRSEMKPELGRPDPRKASYRVVIRPEDAGVVHVVAHEGVHVANAQEFVATISEDLIHWVLSKNLTQYDDELRAYRVTNYILTRTGQQESYADCVNGPCVLGRGIQNVDEVIGRILAYPGGIYKGITPSSPGPRIFADIKEPSP